MSSVRVRSIIMILLCALPFEAGASGGFMFSDESPRVEPPSPASRPNRERGQAGTEAAICVNCQGGRITPGSRPSPLPVPKYYPTVLSFRTRGKPLGPNCRRLFINGQGEFGQVGSRIAHLINNEPYRRYYQGNTSLGSFCPRFRYLSPEQKTQAWIWFWMVLANEESTCQPQLSHGTHLPNGSVLNPRPGYGLFAAERYAQHRAWRGRMCQGDIRNTQVQVNCAVHTMATTQLSRGRGVRWPASYWGPVRRASRQIMPNMRGFKSCF